jgi:hypothetical protein
MNTHQERDSCLAKDKKMHPIYPEINSEKVKIKPPLF